MEMDIVIEGDLMTPFFCQLFQKRNLFYVFGISLLYMVALTSTAFPGAGALS